MMLDRRQLLNFTYILPYQLAGMARPGQIDPLAGDLQFLVDEEIGALVSLTVAPLDVTVVASAGLWYLHLPVEDFTAPALKQVEAFVEFAESMIAVEDRAVAVHCGAGCGRTGTMLACYLVWDGMTAPAALAHVRDHRPGSVETPGQEAIIYQYAEHLKF